ncbi:hypothetical protein Clacol_000541 [Clathrus columnatus]|uniref:Transglycosylase SLT domain-containing protein n=1 Tax=Clathrus columnatus TaxID=1419009 RepID=A0AAV5A025_9AGAM|nr:hypothetical protein Clacol_000541 [Clathrus columnatus]
MFTWACLLVFLGFIPLSVTGNLFDIILPPWDDLSYIGVFKRSAVQPTPKQCVLVTPLAAPVFQVSPGGGGTGGSQSGNNGNQSPPLPGPSETEPGTIRAQSACGPIGATEMIMPLSGPNGASSWLTCGINSTGWTPSYATVQDIITVDLSFVLSEGNSPFQACNQYLDIIEKYATQFNVPPILVSSFAMQESGCQANVQGEGGEQGLMQISQDKVKNFDFSFSRCGGAPNGNCKDPDFNIHQGTQFLSDTLSKNNGNILLTIGQYNGWFEGMTFADATADADSNCCHCQQNLDYLHQMMNGWLLNRNPLTQPRLGQYFNLDSSDVSNKEEELSRKDEKWNKLSEICELGGQ